MRMQFYHHTLQSMRKVINCFYKMIYDHSSEKVKHWLVFVMFFGILPIAIRLFTAVIVNNEITAECKPIAYFVVSDIVFLGLLLNASAMANLSSEKSTPTVYKMTLFFTIVLSIFLVSTYTVEVMLGLNATATLCLAFSLTIPAFLLSYFTVDSTAVRELQEGLDARTMFRSFTEPLQQCIQDAVFRSRKGEVIGFEDFAPFLDERGEIKEEFIRSEQKNGFADATARLV